LKKASFGVDYNPSEIFSMSFESYADYEQPSSDRGWGEPGSGITLTFDSCQGTVPDPTDPEGDGFVVLGRFSLSSYDGGRFSITATEATPVEVTDCEGKTRRIEYLDPLRRVSWGTVGLKNRFVLDVPCDGEGIWEPPCVFGDYPAPLYLCCAESTCLYGGPEVSERACENAGGIWTATSCAYACRSCQPVPVMPVTWGLLKSRY
jgi:hypothetical protein